MSNVLNNPTEKQKKILDFVDSYIRKNNISPSFTDISRALGISTGTVRDQLSLLQKKGLLSWSPNTKRSIKIRSQENFYPNVPIPLLGTISAGEGITIYEDSDPDIIDVSGEMISTGFGYYCLKVSGYSMAEDGILDGDIVVVKQQSSASDGDNVVAVLKGNTEEKVTLKKFYHHGNEIELRPRNQQLKSKFYNPSSIEVRGKFVGLIRQ
jgi:repressor LexA